MLFFDDEQRNIHEISRLGKNPVYRHSLELRGFYNCVLITTVMTIIACSSSSARMKTKTAGDLLTLSARWWGRQKIDNFLALRARSRTSRTVEFSRKNREKRL